MSNISPLNIANIAADIYLVQNSRDIGDFFTKHKEVFTGNKENVLQATVGSRLINTRDSFAVCCRGTNDFKDDIFLIFRGSTSANYGADWISNARIGLEIGVSGLPVHIGFNHIFKSMLPQLEAFFNSLAGEKKPTVVHCIGHSLGGAVATLVADWVSHNKLANETKVYTFGAPRPATHLFAKKMTDRMTKQNFYRVYHESDPVPMIPVFPFCHSPFGNMAYFIHTKPMFWPSDHKMGVYIKSVNEKGKSWESLSPTAVHEPTDAQMKLWLESTATISSASTSAWRWLSSALFYVLRKIIGISIAKLQAAFIGAVTLADNIASLLAQGIGEGPGSGGNPPMSGAARRDRRQAAQAAASPNEPGYWVERLMRKIMQVLGWPIVQAQSLTRSFMQKALQQLIEKSHNEAMRAVRGL
jgi:hypothetical protein